LVFKLVDDNHTFKWVDEAMFDEINKLARRADAVEQTMSQFTAVTIDHEKVVFDRLQFKLDNKMVERFDDKMLECKSSIKKMSIAVIVCCLLIIGLTHVI